MQENISPLTFRRAFGIIIPLCLASLMLCGAIITVANDTYAFVKPDIDISISISEPLTAKDFANLLQEKDVIRNAFAFNIYLRIKGKSDDVSGLLGEWTINSNMSYRELLQNFFS